MISITPIYPADGANPYREVFQPDFVEQRLGDTGRWCGDGATLLGLENPVRLEAFEQLIQRQSPIGPERLKPPPSDPQDALGWRLDFSASHSLSVLWALAPPAIREGIESAHAAGVAYPLWQLERDLSGGDWMGKLPHGQQPAGLFARFTCGANADQTPHLHTTAFLLNLAFHQDGTVGTFTPAQVRNQLCESKQDYQRELEMKLWGAIGQYQRVPGVDLRIVGVPQELCRRFFFDPAFSPANTLAPEQPVKPLRSPDLFAKWGQQAEQWGWGPKQAGEFLACARRQFEVESARLRMQWKLQQGVRWLQGAKHTLRQSLPGARNRSEKPLPNQATDHQTKEHQTKERQSKDQGQSHSH